MSSDAQGSIVLGNYLSIVYLGFSLATAMIGIQIHGSTGWAVLNFIFAPISWVWWLLHHQVNVTIIKNTFSFFLQ